MAAQAEQNFRTDRIVIVVDGRQLSVQRVCSTQSLTSGYVPHDTRIPLRLYRRHVLLSIRLPSCFVSMTLSACIGKIGIIQSACAVGDSVCASVCNRLTRKRHSGWR